MVKPLMLFGMSKSKVPRKMKAVIKEYVLHEVPKIFAPDEVVNIPEFYLTDEVYQLIYESWKRDCLIQEQKSRYLNELYKRARGRHVYQKYDIDQNLQFDEHVFESYHKTNKDQSPYSHLFRPSSVRKMY